jgi:hypothetical protein
LPEVLLRKPFRGKVVCGKSFLVESMYSCVCVLFRRFLPATTGSSIFAPIFFLYHVDALYSSRLSVSVRELSVNPVTPSTVSSSRRKVERNCSFIHVPLEVGGLTTDLGWNRCTINPLTAHLQANCPTSVFYYRHPSTSTLSPTFQMKTT